MAKRKKNEKEFETGADIMAITNPEALAKANEFEVVAALSKERPIYQSIGMGVNNGIFYIGTKIHTEEEDLDAIICSDKKIYVDWQNENEIKSKFKLNYRFPLYFDVVDYSWSNTGKYGIKAWLYGNESVAIKDVYESVLNLIKWKYWNNNELIYKHHALSIVSGFFLPIFEAKGRELVYGEVGWGKTRLSNIYQQLAFNPVMSADFSDSSIFRIIESVKPTIIIDNFDTLEQDKQKRILHIYITGYLAKKKAVRSEGKTFRPTGFSIYSNLLMNTVPGPVPEVAESRSNITRNLKTDDPSYQNLEEGSPSWGITRDMLYFCAMQNWAKVQEIYLEMRESKLQNRELERVSANLTIAKTISEDLYNEMLEHYIKDNERRDVKELEDDWTYKAVEFIARKFGQENEMELKISDITDVIAPEIFNMNDKQYDTKKRGLAIKLGSVFKNCTLFSVRGLHGYTRYTFTRDGVIRFCKMKGFGNEIVDFLKQSGIPTNPPNPTNPTNPPNSPNSEGGSVGSGES